MGQVVVILTGGEPLLRDDIFELAAYGPGLGHRMVMAVNGTLLTPAIAGRLKDAGIQRLSISIDGATAASHDRLRAVPGAFEGALRHHSLPGGRAALPDQHHRHPGQPAGLPAIHELALKLEAAAHHVFVLVPTGRGEEITTNCCPRRNTKRPCAGCWPGRRKAGSSSNPPAPRSSTASGARTPRPRAKRSPRPPTAWRP